MGSQFPINVKKMLIWRVTILMAGKGTNPGEWFGHVTPHPKEIIDSELWRWKIEYDPWCIHVRFPHVSFHRIIHVSLRLILGNDLGDACTKQLNWSFTQVSAASTMVASVTGQCHVCNGGTLPFSSCKV